MAGKSGEDLLIGVRPLRLAEGICRRLVGGVRVVEGALLLDAAPAGAINAVLVRKGVRVSELRPAEDRAAL